MTTINKISSVQVQNQTERRKVQREINGSFLAYGASQVSSMAAVQLLSMATVSGMSLINKKLSSEQIKKINEAADKIIEQTALNSKGVRIEDVKSFLNLTNLPDAINDLRNPVSATAHGKNALFLSKNLKDALGEVVYDKNTILANREKLSTALFHEIGHAFNANKSKFWSAVQKMRTPSSFIGASVILFAAFTKKAEANDGEELTKGQKTKNFVRNNAGFIAGVSMLPVVAEEIMASVRGCKWASANLPKELAKKVKTANIFGAVSYIGTAAGLVLSGFVATKVKDSIMEKQKAKFEAEQNKNIERAEKVND